MIAAAGAAAVGLLFARFRPRARAEPGLRAPAPPRRLALEVDDEFLAILSHELRTPLNAIIGWTRVLHTAVDRETIDRAVAALQRNALAQSQIVEDLLDLSRLTTGAMALDARAINLVPVIESALDAIRPAANAKRIGVAVMLDPAEGDVLGDPARLRQVVWNLLSNAVKFTSAGGCIAVRLRRGAHVSVEVTDTGQGIAPALMPCLFERFRQADRSTTRAHGGLGIGLALVRELVELHGGTVEANSRGIGHGATFTVRFPVPPDVSAPAPAPTPRALAA